MDVVRTARQRDRRARPGRPRTPRREANLAKAVRLFAALPAIVAYDQRRRRGQDLVEPRDDLGYSAELPLDDLRRGARPGGRRRVRRVDDPVRRALLQRLDVHRARHHLDARPTCTRRSSARSARSRARCTAAPTRPSCTSSTRSAPAENRGEAAARASLARRRARREAQDHGLRPPRLQARRLARARP